MTEAFYLSQRVEHRTKPYIECWLVLFANNNWRETTRTEQFVRGDYIVFCPDKGEIALEIKTEEKFTGNLFMETYSNYHTKRLGWLYTCEANILWYMFEDNGIMISMNFQKVKAWLLYDNHIKDFPEVRQQKYKQDNLTVGRLVPTEAVYSACGWDTVPYRMPLSIWADGLFNVVN
jgi:hypothetical protein